MKAIRLLNAGLVSALLMFAVPADGQPQMAGTAFSYQGQLKADGIPVMVPPDLTFTLWDQDSGGNLIGGPEVLETCAFREIPIGGVGRHHPVLHPLQELDGVVASHDRVGRVVLDAEVGRVDPTDDFEIGVLGLRELRVLPVAVLVVVLHAEYHAVLLGVAAIGLDRLMREIQEILYGKVKIHVTGSDFLQIEQIVDQKG